MKDGVLGRVVVEFIWILQIQFPVLGESAIRERYGNLFQMYERITGENALQASDAYLPSHSLYHGWIMGGL